MLETSYQNFVYTARYARWLESERRRETWPETVTRYCDFFKKHLKENYDFEDEALFKRIWKSIHDLEVMPSMRAMMTAGPALERDHLAGYNCAFVAVNHKHAFDEAMYVLSCGTGLGFSVERQYINNLPEVPEELYDTEHVITVADSKLGWASSFRTLISMLYDGSIPKWDMSKVRPAGARLKTFGGRASGPEPLERLFEFTVNIFKRARGRKLTSLECHDIMCKVGECIVVGGVRRSAMISLSNLTDQRMRHAKDGQFWNNEPQRSLANNSVAYTEKPDMRAFLEEWSALYASNSGERGIFSRIATEKKYDNHRRDGTKVVGVNPCGEVLLRNMGLCNLTEVVVRPEDTEKDLIRKHEIATILGTFQSTLTNFRYVRRHWKNNADEERLLGVSMTGIAEHPILGHYNNSDLPGLLEKLRDTDVQTNKKWAKVLGINQSVAVTTAKPSGTVSQLVNCTSGVHPHTVPSNYDYFVRRVQNDFNDPLTQFCIDKGFYVEQSVYNPLTAVISFPLKIKKGTVRSDEMGALDQMKLWLKYAEHYAEHSISCTVYYDDDEFLELGAFVYKHFDKLTGVSFLPRDGGIYQQAPFQGLSKEEYEKLAEKTPKNVDWTELANFEKEDNTKSAQTLACSGGSCEVEF